MDDQRLPGNAEALTRRAVGLILWACSAYLTVYLFLAMAGQGRASRVFMAALAIALEGTKILTWRMGGKARCLAYALLTLSVVASFGAALKTVQEARMGFFMAATENLARSRDYGSLVEEESELDREAAVLVKRLDELPPEYATAATRLSGTLADIRVRKASVGERRASLEARARASYDEENLFVLLGKEFGLKPETVLLVLLLVLSLCVEAGAVVLTSPPSRVGGCPTRWDTAQEGVPGDRTSQDSPRTTEDFLKAAMDGSDLPYLHGREATARRLGISSYRAKACVSELKSAGLVVVEKRRLKFVDASEVRDVSGD